MNISNNQFLSIEQLQDQFLRQQKVTQSTKTTEGFSFEEVLQKTQQQHELKFSKHATNRLSDRNIELTSNQLERLSDGTKKAQEKGIKESLARTFPLLFTEAETIFPP